MGPQSGAVLGSVLERLWAGNEASRSLLQPCPPGNPLVCSSLSQSHLPTTCRRAFAQAGVQPWAPYSGLLSLSHLDRTILHILLCFQGNWRPRVEEGRGRDAGRTGRQRALRARRTPAPRGRGTGVSGTLVGTREQSWGPPPSSTPVCIPVCTRPSPSATVPGSDRRTPRPRGQSPASALGQRGGGGGRGARGSGSG